MLGLSLCKKIFKSHSSKELKIKLVKLLLICLALRNFIIINNILLSVPLNLPGTINFLLEFPEKLAY